VLDWGVDTPAEAAIALMVFVYALAAWINTRIPHTGVTLTPLQRDPGLSVWRNLVSLVPDFMDCNRRLWRDKLGQISLATTTLFWGVSGNLRYIVLAWSALALGYSTSQASSLVGVVAIGTAVGAILASLKTRLTDAPHFILMGAGMGAVVLLMNFITDLWVAIPFLILLGALGGFIVVPMNALLQHRGHNLMGAGRSIAVQNFNEQLCILGLGGLYTLSSSLGVSAYGAITGFGLLVAGLMLAIRQWHLNNLQRYPDELNRLFEVARHDNPHH
jgi:hypothetical protein